MGAVLGRQVNRDAGAGRGPRVLVLAPSPVGPEMAGPAIRAVALARVLGDRFPTTLGVPAPRSAGAPSGPFETVAWSRGTVGGLLRRHDVVVSQGFQYPARLTLRREGRRPVQVFDLYDPIAFEQETGGGAVAGHLGRLTGLLLRRADMILCAGERQRDLWTGGLYVTGAPGAGAGPRIGIVPFGHAGAPPVRAEPVLRGVGDGIDEHDRVLLWGGGVWDWLDPLTLIRAIPRVREADPRVKLVFLAGRHPEALGAGSRMLERARETARSLGLLDRSVFFNDGWVPFGRRGGYLVESDLAVCCAPAGEENRFSCRTRLVDAVWAGLPVVCTHGGAMADFVERHAAGITVPPADPAILSRAVLDALDPQAQRRFRANLSRVRDELSWERCARPLVAFCERVARGEYRRPPEPPWRPWLQYLEYKLPALAGALVRGRAP